MMVLESFNQISSIPHAPLKYYSRSPLNSLNSYRRFLRRILCRRISVIALFASAALLSHFLFSGQHEPGLVAGISLLLAGCCYVAIALTTKQGASMLRSNH